MVKEKYWDYYRKFIPDYNSNTQEVVEYADLDHALKRAIKKLPKKTKLVFELNRLQGLSIEEISERLNVPRRTIEHHLTKSTRSLRIILKDYILFSGWICLFLL
jgi:RNA polymerase sigma-70 factor (ECF subfamily)